MIGTAFSVMIRLELASPGVQFLSGDHQLFNVIISAHAFIMIFFMVMPGLVGGFGNYFLPIHCGAVDMAKNIKLNKFFSFHLNLLTFPSLQSCTFERLRRLRRESYAEISTSSTLNYFIQSIILFFYSFIYKNTLFRTEEANPNFPKEIINTSPLRTRKGNPNMHTFLSLPTLATHPYQSSQASLPKGEGSFASFAEACGEVGKVGSEGLERASNSLNTYLTGLFEGDGHIWIPNISYNYSKKHNPRFCITFHLKDKPLAEKLLQSIGYGFIRIKLKENACVLTVSPLKGLIYVIQLLNGNMRTPKIHQLHSLIDWVNTHHNLNINKLYLSASPLNSDY